MATVALTKPYEGQTSQTQHNPSASGKIRSRDVNHVIPASHGEFDTLKLAGIILGIVFLASIIFWAVGASTNVVGLEITGKIFFSLIITGVGLAAIGLCCCGCCGLAAAGGISAMRG